MLIYRMLKQKIKTEELEIGNLVYYGVFDKPKVAIIVKAKKLLKLYDILIQTENLYVKDVHITLLQKIT
jgi:hypothetical protein